MSERGHDPEPGQAALDELARAFGIGGSDEPVDPPPTRRSDDVPPVAPAPSDDATAADPSPPHVIVAPLGLDAEPETVADAPDPATVDELVDEPVDEPEPTPPSIAEPAAPRIIRIDDITGVVGVGDGTPSGAADAGTAGEPPAAADRPAVIAIDADDLPDAVYVSGSLEGGSNRSIVFIEDDTAGDALQPESDRDLRRGIEPRMRERRVQVKRAQSRKRLKWVVAAGVLLLVAIGGLAVLGSSLFAVRADQIDVVGNVYTDPERLEDILDDLAGTPTLRVDTQRIERELETIAWVEDAKVTVSFPRSASVEIRERQAIATYRGPDGRFRVMDREGRVLDVLDKWPIAYVLVTGPDPVDLEAGQFAPRGYVGASELAKNLTGSVRGQVERIEVTADGQRLSMFLTDGTEVRFGEARDLFTKLVRLETRLRDPEREPGPIDVATN